MSPPLPIYVSQSLYTSSVVPSLPIRTQTFNAAAPENKQEHKIDSIYIPDGVAVMIFSPFSSVVIIPYKISLLCPPSSHISAAVAKSQTLETSTGVEVSAGASWGLPKTSTAKTSSTTANAALYYATSSTWHSRASILHTAPPAPDADHVAHPGADVRHLLHLPHLRHLLLLFLVVSARLHFGHVESGGGGVSLDGASSIGLAFLSITLGGVLAYLPPLITPVGRKTCFVCPRCFGGFACLSDWDCSRALSPFQAKHH